MKFTWFWESCWAQRLSEAPTVACLLTLFELPMV